MKKSWLLLDTKLFCHAIAISSLRASNLRKIMRAALVLDKLHLDQFVRYCSPSAIRIQEKIDTLMCPELESEPQTILPGDIRFPLPARATVARGDIEDYKVAEHRYQLLRANERDLLDDLEEQIEEYTDGMKVVDSTATGRAILKKWKRAGEFDVYCKPYTSPVFGIAMREKLESEGWTKSPEKKGGKDVMVYYSPDDESD